MSATRIATSLPIEQYRALEKARKRLALNRSEAIQQALALWLAARERDTRVARYVAGYQACPDDDTEGAAAVTAWATGLESEGW